MLIHKRQLHKKTASRRTITIGATTQYNIQFDTDTEAYAYCIMMADRLGLGKLPKVAEIGKNTTGGKAVVTLPKLPPLSIHKEVLEKIQMDKMENPEKYYESQQGQA